MLILVNELPSIHKIVVEHTPGIIFDREELLMHKSLNRHIDSINDKLHVLALWWWIMQKSLFNFQANR